MFKSKEDIKEMFYPKGSHPKNDHDFQINVNLCAAVNKAFESFAERIDFYTTYYGCHMQELIAHHPEIYQKYEDDMKGVELTEDDYEAEEYCVWLFHFCFDGIELKETVDNHPIVTPDICKKITTDRLK